MSHPVAPIAAAAAAAAGTNNGKPVGYARVLISFVHKGEQPALVADAIRDAACAYAKNPGSYNTLRSIAAACVTTEKGKARTPVAGTTAAIILATLQGVMKDAADAGARDTELPNEVRSAAADAYASGVRAAFVQAVDAAAAARKAAAEVKAAEKKAAAGDTGADAALKAQGVALNVDGAPVDGPDVAALLSELDSLRAAAAQRDSALSEVSRLTLALAEMTAARDAAAAAAAAALTERDSYRTCAEQEISTARAAAAAAAAELASARAAAAAPAAAAVRKTRAPRAAAAAAAAAA